MVQAAHSAVAERLSKMAFFSGKKKYGKYDKFGVAPSGEVDPTRKLVSTMIGLQGGNRELADWLYTVMKKDGSGGKGKGNGDGMVRDDKDKDKKRQAPGIRDIDFSMKGEMIKTNPLAPRGDKDLGMVRPDPIKKMKSGGLVRGAGCAKRGRGKGKMV